MKFDRNQGSGTGKYALLHLRKLSQLEGRHGALPADISKAVRTLADAGLIDWGDDKENDFFVMRTRDIYSRPSLLAYAGAAMEDGNDEWAREVLSLASKAGHLHPHCKRPD